MGQNSFLLFGALCLLSLGYQLIQLSKEHAAQKDNTFERNLWNEWKQKHMKQYESQEDAYRFGNFLENLKRIQAHGKTKSTYSLGLTGFADMNEAEFKAKYFSTGKWDKSQLKNKPPRLSEININAAQKAPLAQSTSINWVDKPNIVGPVNDQGFCGSCWAFSATEAIQSALAVAGQSLQQLSEEQMVQCSFPQGNEGCNGGWPSWGFEYVLRHPLATSSDYPYTSGNGYTGTCNRPQEELGKASISGYYEVEDNDGAEGCNNLQEALLERPISVCVDAAMWSWLYNGGIYPADECGNDIDHAVLLVGSTPEYWLIQNSWGTSWGEDGYIRLAPGNTCAVCEVASYPVA